MPQQKITLHPKGLYTNVNQLGVVPPGALSETTNVVLSRPGVLGIRRGRRTTAFFAQNNGVAWSSSIRPLRLFNAKLRVGGSAPTNYLGVSTPGIISMMSDGTMYWSVDGATFTKVNPTYGFDPIQLDPITNNRSWYGFEQNGAFFVTTGRGVVKVARPIPNLPIPNLFAPTQPEIDDWSRSGYAPAGVPWGLNTSASLDTSGTGVAVKNDSQTAYRFCFGYRDANNNTHLGAPTSRIVVKNPLADPIRNVNVSTIIPPGINSYVHFWQLYRSLGSSSADTDPGDDEGLIAEGSIPKDLLIDQMSRIGTALTVRTTTAHGLSASAPQSNIILKSDTVIQGVVSTTELSITPTNATLRTINKKTGNAGIITASGTFSISGKEAVNTSQIPILLAADTTTGKVYYMEAGVPYVYIINPDGTYNSSIALEFFPDQVSFDAQQRLIRIIGRSVAYAWNVFDYVDSATGRYYCAEFSTATDTRGYVMTGGALNKIGTTFAGTYTKLTPEIMARSCRLGIWRANDSSQTYWCLAIYTQGQATQLASSTDKGITWSYQYGYLPPDNQFITSIYRITAGESIRNATTGEVTFSYAVHAMHYNYNQQSFSQYVKNPGNSTPFLSSGAYFATSHGGLVESAIVDIHTNATNGYHTMVYMDALSQTNVLLKFVHYSTPWVASGAGNIMGTKDVGTMPGNNDVVYCYGQDSAGNGSLFTDIKGGVFSLEAGVFVDIGTFAPLVGSGSGTKGTTSTGNATVFAGDYAVQTVIDSTHFTLTSVQSPQIDFTTVAANVVVAQTEIFYHDVTEYSYIGPFLYSSQSVEGSLQTNYPPPACRDTTLFRTTGFYANTTQRTLVSVTMIRLPIAGERIYIGGNGTVNYVTAGTTEDVQGRIFKIGTSGTLSAQIEKTIDSLSRVVNINWRVWRNVIVPFGIGSTAFSTFYVSGVTPQDTVAFRNTNSTGASLVIGGFAPNNFYGEAVRQRNLLYYSKTNDAESVPLNNNLRIGSDSKDILRVIPSRDAVFVFKEDGCFVVRGYSAPWQVDPFDLTLQLSIPDSLVTLDNAVFGAFTRGIFKVSDSNVELLSLPVQDLLERALVGDLNEQAVNYGFGLGDNPDHKYLLWLPGDTDPEDYPINVLVYDTFTNEWTTWKHPSRHAVMFKDFSMMFAFQTECLNGENASLPAHGPFSSILVENKTLTPNDFYDDRAWIVPETYDILPVVLTEYDDVNQTITLGDTISAYGTDLDIYDIIVPLGEDPSYVDAIMLAEPGVAGSPVKILNTYVPWLTPGGGGGEPVTVLVEVYRGIRHGWKFAQNFPESPAATNHFSELAVSFREAYWSKLTATFELPAEQQDPPHAPQIVDFDGIHHFGPVRTASKNNFIRTYVPRQSQRGTTLIAGIETGVCGTPIESNGILIILTQGPTSFQRR